MSDIQLTPYDEYPVVHAARPFSHEPMKRMRLVLEDNPSGLPFDDMWERTCPAYLSDIMLRRTEPGLQRIRLSTRALFRADTEG
jgi:hypothetical protein